MICPTKKPFSLSRPPRNSSTWKRAGDSRARGQLCIARACFGFSATIFSTSASRALVSEICSKPLASTRARGLPPS